MVAHTITHEVIQRPGSKKSRVWSRKVSKGLCENESLSSRTPARREILARNDLSSIARNINARPCETLLPPNLTGPKGGLRPSKRGVEPAFWVPDASYRNNTLFLIVRTYVHMVSHFSRDQGCETRPRSREKSHLPVSHGHQPLEKSALLAKAVIFLRQYGLLSLPHECGGRGLF